VRRDAATQEAKKKKCQSDLRWAETNREKKRRHALNSFHRLRVRAAGGEVDESLNVLSVFIEEDFVCQFCFEPCDPALRGRHPRMASIDHFIPVSQGGSHTRENVQLAHFGCNTRTSNKKRAVA